MVNSYLSDSYEKKLKSFTEKIQSMKKRLLCRGFILCGNEPMKLTINSKAYGYTGTELANELAHHNVICEFCDPDYIVFMFTPEIGETGLDTLENALSNISKKDVLAINPPVVHRGEYVMSARKAMFSPKEELPLNECVGKILATVNVSCPPAVPIIVCGEKIDESAVKCMKYYGVDKCWVISS